MTGNRRVYLQDTQMDALLKEERKYNESLRKRRAEAIGNGTSTLMIAQYDHLIYNSDARLMVLYEKNR